MVRYVWLNIHNGEFSNSWKQKEHDQANFTEEELKDAAKRGWKLIKYEVVNDEPFVINNHFKLR